MRFERASWVAVPFATLVSGCAADSGDPGAADVRTKERVLLETLTFAEYPPPPPDISNAWADSPEAALFGRRLFFDPGFSGELLTGDNDGSEHALGMRGEIGKVACTGCHLPESGFSDTRTIRQQVSLGAGWGLRRAPSLLDIGQSKLVLWDGRRDSLFSQPFGVIENAVEMNSSRLYAARHAFQAHRDEYEAIFGPLPDLEDTSRFPALTGTEVGCRRLMGETACIGVMRGAPGDGAEFDGMSAEDQAAVTRVIANVGKAIGAYERLLTCGRSRFDDWMQGDASALSEAEQRGAKLFVGKARCVECHSGPFFSDEKFHNVGLRPAVVATVFLDANDAGAIHGFEQLMGDPLNVSGPFSDGDDGRLPQGIEPELAGAFRTPKLRCVSSRPSFMHTAQLLTLEEVVSFFDRGGDIGGYPGTSEITPLGLTAEERTDLVEFLRSLQGPGPDPVLLTPPN